MLPTSTAIVATMVEMIAELAYHSSRFPAPMTLV
jgi:hypothetical protein